MKYRLGLDMGTNSIGFAVIGINNNNEPSNLIDMGVRIFKDGRNPKDHQPLAVARRQARGMRRQLDRRIQRKHQILRALLENNLIPSTEEERKALLNLNPFELRKEALDRELSTYELGRALFHLGARRGFKSNRLTDEVETETKENENNEKKKLSQSDKISNLTKEMIDNNCRTVGEYLYNRIRNNCGARFRGGDFNCYPCREHYVQEYNAIKAKQEVFHPDIDWNSIYDAIFFQRPLRKQERGKCQFYTKLDRAYQALPSANLFRILSEVNNLKYMDGDGNLVSLNNQEKDLLISNLENSKTLSFDKIRKLLHIDFKFNLEDEKRDKLIGNETAFTMRKQEYFGSIWDQLPTQTQDSIIDTLLEAETDNEILEYLANYNLPENNLNKILKLKLGRKVGKLSSQFLRDCSAIMAHDHIRYDEAVLKMDLHHSYNPITDIRERLPYYGEVLSNLVMSTHPEASDNDLEYKYGKISNPTVHIALNQLRRVVNSLIDHYGVPEQVVVELSRDISDSAEERGKHFKEQAQNQKENERIKEQIKQIAPAIQFPTAWDVKKYKLWEELGRGENVRCCPYCGKPIPANKLFTKEIEIEHILPYSRSMLDSMSNLTLAHSHCNLKKKELTPYEAFSSNPEGYDWSEILLRIENLPQQKRRKFSKDAITDLEKDNSFIARQLNDNRYLSKATKDYLSSICPQNNIWCIPGFNTSILRDKWGLNTLLNNNNDPHFKNRSDHRHHSIDALVIGLTDRSLIQKMALINKNNGNVYRMIVPDFPFDRYTVDKKITDMLVSHKQEHGYQSRIFKETATGLKLVKKRIPISSLTIQQIEEGLVVNKVILEKYKTSVSQGKQFILFKKGLIELGKKQQVTETPEIDVFEKTWITRTPLIDLTDKDILNDRIFNKKISELIKERTKDVISDKKPLKERLEQLSKELNIRRIRYIPFSQEFVKIASVPNKWYEKDGVYCVTIWEIPSNKKTYQGIFVSYQEAYDFHAGKLKEYPKPHPAAKKIMTLFKEDVIKITPKDGNQSYFSRISSYSATKNQIDLQPIYAACNISEWISQTNPKVCNDWFTWNKTSKSSQNFKSINTLFRDNYIKIVRISPDGKLF